MYFIAIMITIITKTVIISGVSLASIDPWLSSHIWPWTLSRAEATVKQLLCWGVSTVFIEIAHYLLFNASGKIRRPPAVPIWSSWEGGELTWQKDTLTHFSPECLSINSTWGLRYLLIASNTSMSCQEGMRSLVFLSLGEDLGNWLLLFEDPVNNVLPRHPSSWTASLERVSG